MDLSQLIVALVYLFEFTSYANGASRLTYKYSLATQDECGILDDNQGDWPVAVTSKSFVENTGSKTPVTTNSPEIRPDYSKSPRPNRKVRIATDRTSGVFVASRSSFPPFLAFVHSFGWENKTLDVKRICGATLIGPRLAMTAYHCLQDKHFLNLKFIGTLKSSDLKDTFQKDGRTPVARVARACHFRDPRKEYLNNDFALVGLDTHITDSSIRPACLTPDTRAIEDQQSYAIGMGAVDRSNRFMEDAQFMGLIKGRGSSCLKDDPELPGKKLDLDTYCTSSETGGTTCRGDSGSGVFIRDQNNMNRLTAVGITIRALDTCELSKPETDTERMMFHDVTHMMRTNKIKKMLECINGEQNPFCRCSNTILKGGPNFTH